MRMLLVCFILLLIWPSFSDAHSGSASYFRVTEQEHSVSVAVSLDLRDLEYAIGLDADSNAEITWGELRHRASVLHEYVETRVKLRRGAAACPLMLNDLAVEENAGNVYAVMSGTVQCASRGAFEIKSELFFDMDAAHRALVEWQRDGNTSLAILTSDQRATRESAEAGVFVELSSFGLRGMLHIWSGFDHLAFLLVLLLPTFGSTAGSGTRVVWRRLLTVITAFTVAHSVTLALAVSGAVTLPERPTEIAIATSVIVAALSNLLTRARSFGVATAFAFGLLHGFGFASALEGLSAGASFATALAGFNLGVEVGQLLVVAAVLPLILWIRRYPTYETRFVPIASASIAVLGSWWVWERIAS
jgi:hypothetical protein